MFKRNVILADADYVNRVAFNLSVNFERMLERRIAPADLAQWLVCVALDGGLTAGAGDVQVILIYKNGVMDCFRPSDIVASMHGQAFRDEAMGEFAIEAYAVAEDLTTKRDFFIDTLRVVLESKDTERVMLLPDAEDYGREVAAALRGNRKAVTLFAMEPLTGTGFSQQLLGYSLMSAMGIRGDEFAERD